MTMTWSTEFDTGIEVIDEQHKRIVDYINDLETAIKNQHNREQIGDVLNNIIDYTQSHFAFEESLQQEAGYKFAVPHKRVHDIFIRKVDGYRARFLAGEQIEEELHKLLCSWLAHHIKHDDKDYVGAVKENMKGYIKEQEKKKGKGWFARFFGG